MKNQLSAFSFQVSGRDRGLLHFLKAHSSKLKAKPQRGFTLIEMLVSIALFAIVMVVCVGALLSLVGANKKAQALEETMNNLNISLDDMVRNLREGDNLDGSVGCTGGSDSWGDCSGGGTKGVGNQLKFTAITGDTWIYSLQGGQIYQEIIHNGSITTNGPVTDPDVSISDLEFYVVGANPNDNIQPRAIITISGTANAGTVKDSTTFHLQATAVQRALDL